MNNQILCTICCFINLNKMVPSAKCSKRSCKPLCIFQFSVAVQICQIKSLLTSFPYFTTRWNKVCCLIQLFKINIIFSKIYRIHPTSDIYSNHIWNHFIGYGHCCSYRTSLSGMYIRHNTDFRIFCYCIITHTSDLLDCFLFYYLCIAESCIYFPLNLYCFHSSYLILPQCQSLNH